MQTLSKLKPIGILGGTFDPIHHGHLRTAITLYEQLFLQEIRFIPCRTPILKQNSLASAEQRLKMLQLATEDQPGFKIDERELTRDTASYTFETLTSIRNEIGDQSLCLIIGSDAFNEFDKWHRWQQLTALAHLIVVDRQHDQIKLSDEVANFLKKHRTLDIKPIFEQPAGTIFFKTLPRLEISSTEIRNQISKGLNPRYLLPENVLNYIKVEKLYL